MGGGEGGGPRAWRGMADGYSRELARRAGAQAAEAAGFEALVASAHEAVAELLVRHLEEVGRASHAMAEHAGRTDVNVNDVLAAFHATGISAEKLLDFLEREEEMPFAHNLARYPVKRRAKEVASFAEAEQEPPGNVGRFLPAFPSAHTFKRSAVFQGKGGAGRGGVGKQTREGEAALSSLHGKLEPTAALNFTKDPAWEGVALDPEEGGGQRARGPEEEEGREPAPPGKWEGGPGEQTKVRMTIKRKENKPRLPVILPLSEPDRPEEDVTVQAIGPAAASLAPPAEKEDLMNAGVAFSLARPSNLQFRARSSRGRKAARPFVPVNASQGLDPEGDRKRARAEKILELGASAAEDETTLY